MAVPGGALDEWLALGQLLDGPEESLRMMATCLCVRDKRGRLVPLRANAVQRAYELRRGRENIVLKARQMGMSTWVAGRMLLKTLLVPGTTTLMVAHTRDAAEGLFATVARMWENLPTEMRAAVAQRGRSNVGQMTFPVVDSEIRVASAAEPNAGRGMSLTNLHCSEVSRWMGDAAETLAGLRAALVPGGELVMESTPNGAYGCFYAQWMQAKDDGVERHFFPWWMEPGYVATAATALTAEELELGLTAEQIGFRRGLAKRFGALRAQEFAEDAAACFLASGCCFFEVEAVERRLAEVERPVTERRGGALQVWLPAVEGRQYLIAADPAGGGSEGDYAALQVVDERTGWQCAELQARMGPRQLAAAIGQLSREYNRARVVVERNNHGAAVLAFLEQEPEREQVPVVAGKDGQAGWLTDAGSRPRMLQALSAVVSQRPERLKSERLLRECRSFVTDERGRAAAARGAHDDLVMSMAMAVAVLGR